MANSQFNTNIGICWHVQEVFHVYLNKFEIAVSHLFLIIFSNNKLIYIGCSDLRECTLTKKIALNFIHWI